MFGFVGGWCTDSACVIMILVSELGLGTTCLVVVVWRICLILLNPSSISNIFVWFFMNFVKSSDIARPGNLCELSFFVFGILYSMPEWQLSNTISRVLLVACARRSKQACQTLQTRIYKNDTLEIYEDLFHKICTNFLLRCAKKHGVFVCGTNNTDEPQPTTTKNNYVRTNERRNENMENTY